MAKQPVKPVTPVRGPVTSKETKTDSGAFAFGKINFRLLIGSVALLLIGFIMMAGGKADNPAVFNEEVFSFRRITLAPLVVMAGYALAVYAIIRKAD
jgi:hypothetical protein